MQDPDEWRDYDIDGFIVVYSIIDRRSYQKACDVISSIRDQNGAVDRSDKPIVLVANKSDLERSRMIGKEGIETKYIEIYMRLGSLCFNTGLGAFGLHTILLKIIFTSPTIHAWIVIIKY